jgi:hypothetical protein
VIFDEALEQVRPFTLVRPPLAQASTLAPPLFGCAPHTQSTSSTKGVSSQPWCALYKSCLKPCAHCLTPCTLYHTSAPSSQATFSKIACALSFPLMHPQALAPLSSMIALMKLSAPSLKPCALLISRNPFKLSSPYHAPFSSQEDAPSMKAPQEACALCSSAPPFAP